jgi:formate C-acetyltransferase
MRSVAGFGRLPGRMEDGRRKIQDGQAVAVFDLPSSILGPAASVGAAGRGTPECGRGDSAGLRWAVRIAREFAGMVVASPTPGGWRMSPGLFSWASTLWMGSQTGATPDGRGAGEPISFGANPNAGRLHGGAVSPTALSSAVARVQCGYGNPSPLQLDVDFTSAVDAETAAKFEALIRTHFRLGGSLINVNVLDREVIEDACRHPEKHGDLIVRVTGFSAYFASLSDGFRRLVCERIVAGP